ncbi:hypothetical protein GLW04_08680 [Halobacillus litoralis]|uniref:Uncharacterized protein n=1 Tax=Halobacillus litoralis TaxID=45668 RepID=A0A845DT09_9BACI|nr:hypothetical protein [Halobacillus litoralis]MYL19959.1 hypothetical protein [Halobacillus litoralis]
MGKQKVILKTIIFLLAVVGVITLMVFVQSGDNETNNSLMVKWDQYMDTKGYNPIEVHQTSEHFIFSTFLNEERNQLGVLEYSEGEVIANTSEIKEDSTMSYVFLDGDYRNYLGVRFNESMNDIGKLVVETKDGNKITHDLYNREDGSTRSNILIETSFGEEDLRNLILISKSGEMLYKQEVE